MLLPNITLMNKKVKIGALPINAKGKFFGLPFKIINQFDLSGKVDLMIYEDTSKSPLIVKITDQSEIDFLIDAVASWIFKNSEKSKMNSFDERDIKEVHKRIKPYLSNLLKEVKDYNRKSKKAPVKSAIKKSRPVKKAKAAKKTAFKNTYQRGTSNKTADESRKALSPGKRKSATGRTYYEYRKNRSDMPGSLTGKKEEEAKRINAEILHTINLYIKKRDESQKRHDNYQQLIKEVKKNSVDYIVYNKYLKEYKKLVLYYTKQINILKQKIK